MWKTMDFTDGRNLTHACSSWPLSVVIGIITGVIRYYEPVLRLNTYDGSDILITPPNIFFRGTTLGITGVYLGGDGGIEGEKKLIKW